MYCELYATAGAFVEEDVPCLACMSRVAEGNVATCRGRVRFAALAAAVVAAVVVGLSFLDGDDSSKALLLTLCALEVGFALVLVCLCPSPTFQQRAYAAGQGKIRSRVSMGIAPSEGDAQSGRLPPPGGGARGADTATDPRRRARRLSRRRGDRRGSTSSCLARGDAPVCSSVPGEADIATWHVWCESVP